MSDLVVVSLALFISDLGSVCLTSPESELVVLSLAMFISDFGLVCTT